MKTRTKTKEAIGDQFLNKPAKKTVKKVAAKKTATKKKNPLISAIEKTGSVSVTENGAKTFKTTLNANLDFFAMGSACRNRTDSDVISLFSKAISEDRLLAAKNLFHTRNIRGGAGERKTFRTLIKFLATNYKDTLIRNFSNIALFGRYDDFLCLLGTPVEKEVLVFLKNQIDEDVLNYQADKPISLLAKWLSSPNASSAATKAEAKTIYKAFGWHEKQYRKTLSALRAYLDVVEVKMSESSWEEINYSAVPSKAAMTYRKAFGKHDQERYAAYLASVEKGEAKINAAALYPYEIYDKAKMGGDKTIDLLWENLPNYLEGNDRNILVVADVSGSMSGRPMSVSVSLALYTAERNKGAFNGYFMTFSSKPTLQKVVGKTVSERFRNLERADWEQSTNLQGVFTTILDHAVKNKVAEKDMPSQVIIVSDMEFNAACGSKTNLEAIQDKYKKAGYTIPNLVFWNANSRQNNVAAQADERGVLLVSGASPSVFKTLLSGTQYTPVDQMLETLNNKMYDCVLA